MPTGIENFGNTCYMNATLQCLKAVPELVQALDRFQTPGDRVAAATAGGAPQALTTGKIYYTMYCHVTIT